MAERRELGEEGRQESLFGAPAPPRAPEPERPWAAPPPRQEVVATPADEDELARLEAFAPEASPPFAASVDALVDEPFAEPAIEEVGERRVPRTAGMPLAGPTLDDVLSRVWEGLATGLPAACPLCHGEVEPAPGAPVTGRCRSCGTSIH
jgi:hypothetical protein